MPVKAALFAMLLLGFIWNNPTPLCAGGNDVEQPAASAWDEADRRWNAFASESGGTFVEIRGALIAKYLGGQRIFARGNQLFVLSMSGEVSNLGMASWLGDGGKEGYFRNEKYSAFLKARNIQVSEASQAIECVRLSREVLDAPTLISALRENTRDYRLFDRRIYRGLLGDDAWWTYRAERKGDSWVVTPEYAGPPDVSIMEPPVWEIVVDPGQRLTEIRQRRKAF